MKKILILLILIFLSIIQGVAGFSVSEVKTSPSGYLSAGTPVTVIFFIPGGNVPLNEILMITTDLTDPAWTSQLLINGKDSGASPLIPNGNTLTVPWGYLSYPIIDVKLQIQLKGTVPSNPSVSQKLLNIKQVDSNGVEMAYPPAFNLPMPVSSTPPPTISTIATIIPTITENALIENMITATPTSVPTISSLITIIPPSKKSTKFVPTPYPSNTPTTVSPVNPLIIIGAIGIIIYMIRQ